MVSWDARQRGHYFARRAVSCVNAYPPYMDPLPKKCVPCEGGILALTDEEATERHALIPSWTLSEGKLSHSYELKDFRAALAWVNRVGMLAEEEGHHPNFHITGWNQVELVLYTHAVGGLTDNDFVLAKAIDDLAVKDGHSEA